MGRDDSVAPLTMNPYQVLGVAPTASMDEIEAAYRQQLRAHHPDLHQGESPEELAAAEATTRSLNEAMALVRAGLATAAGHRGRLPLRRSDVGLGRRLPIATRATGGDGADHGQSAWNSSFATDPDTDWFGNPLGPRRAEAVDCPICGQVFSDPLKFRSHLQRSHHIAGADGPKPPKAKRDRLAWLTWIPAPTFWLFALLLVYWAVVVAVLPTPLDIVGIWLGVIVFALPAHPGHARSPHPLSDRRRPRPTQRADTI